MLNPIREEKKKRARVLPRAYFLSCVKFYTTKHSANDPARRRRLQISFHTHTGSSFFLLLSAVLRHAPPHIANSDRIVPIVFSVICLVSFLFKECDDHEGKHEDDNPCNQFQTLLRSPSIHVTERVANEGCTDDGACVSQYCNHIVIHRPFLHEPNRVLPIF